MLRIAIFGSICVWGATTLCGCSSFLSARAIDAFSSSLSSKNIADLKAHTSKEFEVTALRREDSLEALDILRLPTQDFTVRDVENLSPTSRLVTVAVGKEETIVKYKLKREDTSRLSLAPRWVVDDVIMTRTGGAGVLERSVAEQMSLLLTIQDFLAHWTDGSREQVVSTLAPNMQAKLSALPPVFLARLTRETLDGVRRSSFHPDVKVHDNEADVTITKAGGKLALKLQKTDNIDGKATWKVTSILSGSKGGREKTDIDVSDRADLYGTVAGFLDAYRQRDGGSLAKFATDGFYKDVLDAADLTSVPLPVDQLLTSTPTMEFQGKRVEMVFDLKDNSYLVSVQINDTPGAIGPGGQPRNDSRYRVEELTIYEGGGKQIKPLSSLFTAQAIVELYSEMLAERNSSLLKTLSTARFNETVWDRVSDPALVKMLPLHAVPGGDPHPVTTVFLGSRTEVMVTQGTRALTYVLQSSGGRPLVDDVIIPSNNQNTSLRETLEAAVPVYNFASAWQRNDKSAVERHSSDGLRRLVFLNATALPNIGVPIAQHLMSPFRTMKSENETIRVTLGDGQVGADVRLVRQNGLLVVEDFSATGPQVPDGAVDLAATVRNSLMRGRQTASPRTTTPPVERLERSILQTGNIAPDQSAGTIQRADYIVPDHRTPASHVPGPLRSSLLEQAIPIPGVTATH